MTDGTCAVCGDAYTKRGMTRHLTSCLADLPTAPGTPMVHLRITAPRRSDYWLHLGVEETTTLNTLDAFLRELWLECCGHMSGFTVGEVQYVKPYHEDETPSMFGVDRRSMDVPLATVLDVGGGDQGQAFTYEYDFGTTTELTVQVVDTGVWDLAVATIDGIAGAIPQLDGIHLVARKRSFATE